MLIRPGPRFDSRPPAVYDNLMSINGLAKWEDLTNQLTRFIAFDTSKLYKKATSGETWDAGTSGLTVTRLTTAENYRGKLYMMFDDGAGVPSVAAVYDGTNLSTSPYTTPFKSRVVVTAADRLFFFYPRLTITPLGTGIPNSCYDWTSVPVLASLVVKNVTLTTGAVECQLFPTATTGAYIVWASGTFNIFSVDDNTYVTWRADLKSLSPSNNIPITLKIGISGLGVFRNTLYALGDLIVNPALDSLWKCTVAGTTAGGAPAYTASLGADQVDGGATFTCVKLAGTGTNYRVTIASSEITVINSTDSPDFQTFFLTAKIPQAHNIGDLNFTPLLSFGTTAQPALAALEGIAISHKDGLADGDIRKKNFGQQLTSGPTLMPFINTETATSATINMESIIWSETSSVPPIIRMANNYEPKELAGLATAGYFLSKRLVMFKRRGIWIFALQSDPDNPIIEERIIASCGAVSPVGVSALDDELFFIGENECYRMRLDGDPTPFCGDAMREEIMAKGANWVESQSVYNLARLAIDQKNREVYVYTQKGKYYVFNLATGAWSTCDIQGKEIAAMAYNPATTKMEISLGGFGLVRLDDTTTSQDTIDNTATNYPVTKDIIMRPFELYHPRAELCLHEVGLFHLATAAQTNEALYLYTSNDRGTTFPHYMEVRFDPTIERVPLSIYQFGVSVTPKISHVGSAGRAAWALSKAEAAIELLAGEWPWTQPTQIASSL